MSDSVNYILLLGKWYVNTLRFNDCIITSTEFIDLLKEKLESIRLACTSQMKEKIISQGPLALHQEIELLTVHEVSKMKLCKILYVIDINILNVLL